MAEFKTNVMRILDRKKIAYTPHEYEHSGDAVDGITAAARMGQPPEKVFKTLVTLGASKNYRVFVIPVEKELDLKKAARAAGEKSVAMIHVAEINAATGYIRGGCSPIGMKKQYATAIDQSAEALSTMIVSAGRIGSQIEIAPADLCAVVRGKFADLTKEGNEER